MLHHVNDASFALPELLKDRTMHSFVSVDEEAGEFSVVMSHADVKPDDTLGRFADSVVTGLAKAMPDFSLVSSTERTLDDTPAIELAYDWRSRFKWLHQRQVLVLVPGVAQGTREALLVAATCPKEFAHKWHPVFEEFLGSFALRDRSDAAVAAVVIAPSVDASIVFALCPGRRSLVAFADPNEACRNTDSYEVQEDAWRFFDAAGRALQVRFAKPRAWWRKPGNYVLETQPGQHAPRLREQLHGAESFVSHVPSAGLSSIADVLTMLDLLAKE